MLTAVQGPVDAANAIVSYYPEFEGFGEFIRNGKYYNNDSLLILQLV